MELQACEIMALENSALLIKYAAESPKKLPDEILVPITGAWKAREDKVWAPDVATNFWKAYSDLCDFIKPVTLDTIATTKASVPTRSWILFGRKETQTLGRRTIDRYLLLLGFLLIISVIFGYINSSTSTLSDEIQKLTSKGDSLASEISDSLSTIKADIENQKLDDNALNTSLDDSKIKSDTRAKIKTLRDKLQELYYISDLMNYKVNGISEVTKFSQLRSYQEGDLSRLPNLTNGYANLQSYYDTRRGVAKVQQNVFLLNSLYAALVPMLLGAVGACTYVLRLMSEQLRDATFSSTSPVRHFVRITLGAMGGVAVGLGLLGDGSKLSAAALSFLAGYAVEPVFSTLDGIAEKFRRS
jgi:hypothetical protein